MVANDRREVEIVLYFVYLGVYSRVYVRCLQKLLLYEAPQVFTN
jgi:hypothetical protein